MRPVRLRLFKRILQKMSQPVLIHLIDMRCYVKNFLLIAAVLLISTSANSQQSLTDQINAVDAVQEQRDSSQQAAQEAYERRISQQQKAAAALAAQRQEAIAARNKQREEEALSNKKRDQAYEDQLRAIDLQEKTLKIEAEKARVARSNEYIDQELKEKAAQTDVIKSQADSNRDLSEGTKTLLEKTGDAEVKSQSGLFK